MATVMLLSSPPRPRLVVRIGVTGHRPNKLADADRDVLRDRVAHVVGAVKQVAAGLAADRLAGYREAAPVVRVISSLAEGSDRVVAEVGIAAGLELQVVLPNPVAEYARDFQTDASRAEFQRLLARASAVLTLDGAPRLPAAYERAGHTVVQQCDLLIAIWDGENAAGPGGTAEIVRWAAERDIVVYWIRSQPPHETSLVRVDGDELKTGGPEELSQRLMDALTPPARGAVADLRERYFAEPAVRGRLGHLYGILTRLVSRAGKPWPRLLPRDYLDATRATWRALWVNVPDSITRPVESALLAPYAWADQLATYYANRHRSAFTWSYLLAPLAVLLAFGKDHDNAHRIYWIIGYVAVLVSLLTLYWVGKRSLWHERWLDYRSLAEQLRHLVIFFPLGKSRVDLRVPAHAASGDPRTTWVHWYVRAVAAEAGLVSAVVDQEYLAGYRALLSAELDEQITYHTALAANMRGLYRRLNRVVVALFVAGLGTSVLALFDVFPLLVTPLAALLPALAAAVYGFLGQGEFRNLARRSEGVRAELQALLLRLQKRRSLTNRSLERAADDTVEVMGGELIDWRVEIGGKPLSLPKAH